MKNLMLSFICTLLAIASFAAKTSQKDNLSAQKSSSGFLSAKDLSSPEVISNITVKNSAFPPKSIYGLYVKQLSYVLPGQPCTSSTVIYSSSANISAGAVVMRVVVDSEKEADVGANFLYNMIYSTTQYVQATIPVSPPGCMLPGCTWGSDTTRYNWCIHLGIIAPVSVQAGFSTSNVVPMMSAVSSTNYNYNKASNYQNLGPISCDDQQLTCTVATVQTQTF